MIRTLFIILTLGLSSCSTLKELTKESGVHRQHLSSRKWAVSNLNKEYLGFRLRHAMTPLLVEDLIIQGNSIDGISAYKKNDGQKVWQKTIPGGVEGGAALWKSSLFFGSGGGRLYSLDVHTGRLRWTFPIKFEGLSAPHVNNGTVYITSGNNVVYAIDAQSGQQKWLYKRRVTNNFSVRGGGEPTSDSNYLYLGFSDGYLVALNKRNGRLAWEKALNYNRRFKDIDATPTLSGNKIYVSSYDDSFYCLDKANGRVLWRAKDVGGSSKALIVKDRIYVASSQNKLYALDKSSGKTLWVHKTRGLPTAPKALGRTIVVGERQGQLKFLNSLTGEEYGAFWPGRGVSSAPSLDYDKKEVFFLSVDANLFAIKSSWQKHSDLWPWEKL